MAVAAKNNAQQQQACKAGDGGVGDMGGKGLGTAVHQCLASSAFIPAKERIQAPERKTFCDPKRLRGVSWDDPPPTSSTARLPASAALPVASSTGLGVKAKGGGMSTWREGAGSTVQCKHTHTRVHHHPASPPASSSPNTGTSIRISPDGCISMRITPHRGTAGSGRAGLHAQQTQLQKHFDDCVDSLLTQSQHTMSTGAARLLQGCWRQAPLNCQLTRTRCTCACT